MPKRADADGGLPEPGGLGLPEPSGLGLPEPSGLGPFDRGGPGPLDHITTGLDQAAPDRGALEAVLDAGFIYWGLFVAFGLILIAYIVWMRRSER